MAQKKDKAAEEGAAEERAAEQGTATSDPMRIEVALVRELATLLDETHLTEIEVQDGDRVIRVVRQSVAAGVATVPVATAPAAPPPAPPAAPTEDEAANHPGTVRSPMVGTAYLSAEPGAKPFVSAGQQVAQGDTLLIIEAMKVMNPITAPRAGTLKAILIGNEQPVEFEQPLVIIE